MAPSKPTQWANALFVLAALATLTALPTTAARALLADQATAPTSEDSLVSRFDGVDFLDPLQLADKVPQIGSDSFHGDGTAFSDAVNNTGAAFACSFRYLNNWASQYFVAMNEEQWNDGLVCGSCVRARCVDPKCPVQNVDIVAMVVDRCPECSYGDLDFSYPAYSAVTGSWPNRLKVSWEKVDCSAFIDGTIRMWPKDGVNPFWQAFYFANSKYQIQNVTLNGVPLTRQTFGFWIHPGTAPTGPSSLVFTAVNGATVNATLNSVWDAQDLDVQFPEVTDAAPVATAGRR
ncbi:hypothetical protein ACKKBF_B15890 [Auxenochlorella protothecoides x Auxenochlorella symbiontica]